jgi:PAS domain S-box-containing protein
MNETMSDRRRFLHLTLIMMSVAIGVTGIAFLVLYEAAFEQQRGRLVETVQSHARLMEAVARFDAQFSTEDIPGGAFAATLLQIRNAHKRFRGFGKTGEFTLAKREGDQIVFLLSHRHHALENPEPISFSGDLAEPMRRALSGESGAVSSPDYRGEMVLAAYEPVEELDLGIVAKIDLAEIRAPFINAGLLGGGTALVLIFLGTVLFRRITNPLVRRLEQNERKYRTLFESATDGVLVLTDVFEECNEQACRLWACEREDIVGHSLVEFSPPTQPDGRDSAEAAKGRTEAAFSGVPQLFSWQNRRKDGVLIDAEICLKAIDVGNREIILTTIRDVTERKQLEMEVLECCSREQRRIGQDLHDGLGQNLAGIGCLTKVLEQKLTAMSLAEAAEAGEIATLVNQTVNQTRDVARGLCPVQLESHGLLAALQELASRTRTLHSVACRFQYDRFILIHDHIVATHLYYVAQEAVTNAIKHGKPQQIFISLSAANGQIILTVKDDGIGFPEVMERHTGMGLHIMNYRARMMDGFLTVQRDAGGGTCVTCSFRPPRTLE